MLTGRAVGVARAFVCLAYALGAATHVYFFTQQPELYRSVADQAVFPLYRDLWQGLIVPTLDWSPVLVVAFEASVAILSARRGRAVLAANSAAALFQVGLAPMGPWGVVNLALAALHLWVARASARGQFERSLVTVRSGRREIGAAEPAR